MAGAYRMTVSVVHYASTRHCMFVITAQLDNDMSGISDKSINCAISNFVLHLICGVAEPFAAQTSEQCAS